MTAISLTKRLRRRRLKSGEVVVLTRYVLNYREPRTGMRRQLFFSRQKEAAEKQSEIQAQLHHGTYANERKALTMAEAVARWLADREGEVKTRSMKSYRTEAKYIVGPLLIGTARQRAEHTATGMVPEGARLVPLLGDKTFQELTTAEIRAWHKLLSNEVGAFTANRAKSHLSTVLSLAAEDLNLRPPAMPTKLGRGRFKGKKTILMPEQIATLIRAAREDRERGIYYAFPFLTGTRPSEQLALLWEDVDLERNAINISRMQETDGSITNFTKTVAGAREIPMCSTLRQMLLEWRLVCPRLRGELHRVFPGLGFRQVWPLPRKGGGGALLYPNFRKRIWGPGLKKSGLPQVTPHSARHSFISTLQAQGIEIGLVAKIAGHANAAVTLGHYTQAVRGAENAVAALERAFSA